MLLRNIFLEETDTGYGDAIRYNGILVGRTNLGIGAERHCGEGG